MKRNAIILFLLPALLLVILAGMGIGALLRLPPETKEVPGFAIGFGASTVRAEVAQVLEEGTITLGEITQPYQILQVRLLEGPFQGFEVEIDYGRRQVRPGEIRLRPGEQVLVTTNQLPDGRVTAYFTDFVRSRPLLILFGAFALFSILVSGWKGVRSLVALAASLLVITQYILPQILAGRDPVLVSITGAFFLLAFTLYVTYGWTLKTHAAVLGTLAALILTGLLASFFIDFTRLTGFGSEDALFLTQLSSVQLNLRGLVLGGMLIGALGVLDDLVITQASAVFELHHTATHNGFVPSLWGLFRSGMRIGQDHVAATVNTLVLAYAGGTLPALLLFSLSGENFGYLVNLEFVTEEIVRTLVGSLGLISAVPLSTLLACLLALYHPRLGALACWLGPPGEGHTH